MNNLIAISALLHFTETSEVYQQKLITFSILSELSFLFFFNRITETKPKPNISLTTNIEIQGYHFVSEPSLK